MNDSEDSGVMDINDFTHVRVFSATKMADRHELGETVTRWLRDNEDLMFEDLMVVDKAIRQSSDSEFHCLSITLFMRERKTK